MIELQVSQPNQSLYVSLVYLKPIWIPIFTLLIFLIDEKAQGNGVIGRYTTMIGCGFLIDLVYVVLIDTDDLLYVA